MFDNIAVRVAGSLLIAGIILLVIYSALPIFSMPPSIEDSIGWLFETIWKINFILPVPTLVTAVWLYLLVDIIFLGVKIIIWVQKIVTKTI